jgi:GAF domain-containing protein
MADLAQELRDARAREAATSEILRVINRSPTDYQPVFEAILEHATRLCDASLGFLCLREDEGFRFVADRGTRPETSEHLRSVLLPLDPERSATAKAATERRPFEVLDVADAHSHGAGESARRIIVEHEGIRTLLTVPMLRGDESVGVILIYRREVRSFEPSHIELLTTFAEQAAIAVDNVRRFRALGEALERQTATSDILRTISRSPTDYQPVFDTILENATRLCDAPLALLMMRHDDGYHLVAHEGTRPEYVEFLRANLVPLDPGSSGTGQAGTERRPVQMADVTDSDLYREGQVVRTASADIEGIRSALWVPMIKNDECLGVICLYRREVRPFDQSVVDLVLTFANQAVIAIDNVRLFQALEARTDELGEALERQTATSDILRAISRSPTDYGPVFDVILDSATRLCEAPLAVLILREGEHYHLVAHRGTRPEFVEWFKSNPVPVDAERSFSVRAATEGVPLQIPDFTDTEAYRHGAQHQVAGVELEGIRSALLVPMMKGDDCVGVIAIYRREVQPFDESHIGVVSTFADQAVIAIDNVRLFQALEARTDELGEALERQTATSDILRTISRSPTDYGPVFDAILESSTRLCDAPLAYLLMRKEEHFHYVAHKGGRPEFVEWSIENPVPVDSPLLSSRAAREGVPQQLADITESEVYRDGVPHRVVSADLEGIRSALFVPMMKGGECVGIICLYRREVRPFDQAHVALVSTFGDQAVIAIDNVRLFQALEVRTDELGEALERQTATSDILRTISRSPTDYGPVFEAILDSATRLCDAPLAFLLMREGDHFHIVADKGSRPEFVEWLTSNPISISEGKTLGARAAIEGVPQQLADLTDSEGYRNGMPHRVAAVDIEGVRTALFVPMMKDNECVGAMSVYRREVRLFDESQIALLSTFVDQAVIAIDNVRGPHGRARRGA